MCVCTFFGHRDCPTSIKPKLREVLIDLIEHHSVARFYVGRQGAFDRLALAVLRELAQEYPQIRFAVVLERLPEKQDPEIFCETLLPEGLENVPPRFAIHRRNQWMLQQADYVVTCVTHISGGAARFAEMAVRQRKTVLNLAEPSRISWPRKT